MKKLFVILMVLLSSNLMAQTDGFNYQAVIRNSAGEILSNQNVSINVLIHAKYADGTLVYGENHKKNTNPYGVINIQVGMGDVLFGNFSQINWAEKTFLEIEIDEKGGSAFKSMGTNEILSVPVALFAKRAQNIDDPDSDPKNEIQELNLSNTTLTLSKANSVDLSVLQDGFTDADADIYNELQNLVLTENTLSVTNAPDNKTIDLSKYLDNTDKQTLTVNRESDLVKLSIKDGNQVSFTDKTEDSDADPLNEIQDLKLDGNILTITKNGSATMIDLSIFLDNTDNQELSINDHTLSIGGGNSVKIPDNVNDADYDPSNEIQDLSLNGNDLKITNNTNATTVSLSKYIDNTDAQTLSMNNNHEISITNGNTIDLKKMQVYFSPNQTPFRLEVANDGSMSMKEVVLDVDGNVYATIKIGSQTWMAENLKVKHAPDGSDISTYVYADDTNNESVLGLLYDWDAAMNGATTEISQGICPDGWHMPSNSEWQTLMGNLTNGQEGTELKVGGSSGFEAKLGGARYTDASYKDKDVSGNFWSSTQSDATNATSYSVYYNQDVYVNSAINKTMGYSVRCLKN